MEGRARHSTRAMPEVSSWRGPASSRPQAIPPALGRGRRRSTRRSSRNGSTTRRSRRPASITCSLPAAETTPPDPYAGLPSQITLTGNARDFKERGVTNGQADFELTPTRGFAHYVGEAANTLDADGKPAYASTGKKVTAEWKDAAGHNIIPIVSPDLVFAYRKDIKGVRYSSCWNMPLADISR